MDISQNLDYREVTWTPIDASGAGLSLAGSVGKATKIGNRWFVTAIIIFPATADGSSVLIGGLPAAYSGDEDRGGLTVGYSNGANAVYCLGTLSGTTFTITSATAPSTNANLSGVTFFITGSYT